MPTCGEALVELLRAYGIDTVFGIPGVHTVEMYRGLKDAGLRHVTPRHEQGAALMAYGYALAAGRPAACFLITGPGVLNAATGICEAYSDSVPVLVVASVNRTNELAMGGGRLHEIPSQQKVLEQVTAFTHTLLDPRNLPEVLARAFTIFAAQRPRPVCIEIPTDVLDRPTDIRCEPWPVPTPPIPDAAGVAAMARRLAAARRPVLILGGGAAGAAREATQLAEKVDAPVLLTQAGKGIVPEDHPLCLGFGLPMEPARRLVEEADVILAVGTELSETDRYMFGDYAFHGALLRIDIDPQQLMRNYRPSEVLLGDAKLALAGILEALAAEDKLPAVEMPGATRASAARAQFDGARLPRAEIHHRVLDVLREALPQNAIVSADSAQLAYAGAMYFPCRRPRSWYFPCGFGTLGTGLPVAIGAKLAAPERPVACIVGDGGFLYTSEELAVAVEERLPLPIILWNNGGYGEIRDAMAAKNIPQIGVNFRGTDFVAVARGFGCDAARAESLKHLHMLVSEALQRDRPTLIEIEEGATFLRDTEASPR